MIEKFVFDSGMPGETLLFLGAVHGNEPCGPTALREAIAKFECGEWVLQQGRVVIVPVCNPRAFAQNIRQIDRNLNRSFYPKENPVTYEDELDNLLCPIVADADFIVDIHSYTVGSDPYTLIESPSDAEKEFAAVIGVRDVLYGWQEAYDAVMGASDPLQSQGLVNYARTVGANAVTLECGQHDDPRSVDVARMGIENTLVNLGFVAGEKRVAKIDVYRIVHSIFKERDGDFVRPWNNLEPIKAGDVITRYDDGAEILAPHDGVVLLTKPWAKPGGEWFNTAVRE